MTVLGYVYWTALVVIILAILTGIQFRMRRKMAIWLRILILVIKVLLVPAAAYFTVVTENAVAYSIGNVIAALYVALFGDAVGDLVSLSLP